MDDVYPAVQLDGLQSASYANGTLLVWVSYNASTADGLGTYLVYSYYNVLTGMTYMRADTR